MILERKDYIELFEKHRKLRRGSKIQKAIRIPRKALFTFMLTLVAHSLNRCFKITADTFWNDKMAVAIPEAVSLGIYRFGLIEEGLTRMVLEYLKPGATFLDIGAHFGYFTLLSSEIVGKNGQVHSFEPTPSTFATLRSNVSSKENVFVNNCAVWSESKNIAFYECRSRYSGVNSFLDENWNEDIRRKFNPRELEVPAVSLDEYVFSRQIVPDFIKVDAENAEYEILMGMAKTISNFRPTISLEVGNTNIQGFKGSPDCIRYLHERGYQAYEYSDRGIVELRQKDQYKYDNILFLPR